MTAHADVAGRWRLRWKRCGRDLCVTRTVQRTRREKSIRFSSMGGPKAHEWPNDRRSTDL